jgi:hypothetical protein
MNSQSGGGSMHKTPMVTENRQDNKNAGVYQLAKGETILFVGGGDL